MAKLVKAHVATIADTIRLDVPVGSQILGVERMAGSIVIFSLSSSEQEKTHLRFFRIVLSGTPFESEATEEYIGSVPFGVTEVYHVFEIPPPNRGGQNRELGLP